jgi:hypothetical protein
MDAVTVLSPGYGELNVVIQEEFSLNYDFKMI